MLPVGMFLSSLPIYLCSSEKLDTRMQILGREKTVILPLQLSTVATVNNNNKIDLRCSISCSMDLFYTKKKDTSGSILINVGKTFSVSQDSRFDCKYY